MSSGDAAANNCAKHSKMHQVVAAMQEYLHAKNKDNSLHVVNMHLQSLSSTSDLSVFDPHTPIAVQFYTNLHHLFDTTDNAASQWKCVEVLCNVCANTAARDALIHTYHFIPALTRLLTAEKLSNTDRHIQILRLMQNLTYGIEITFEFQNLPQLMSTLSQWILTSDNFDIISVSLSILVNLLYNNPAAVHVLMVNVDVRKIIKCNADSTKPIIALYMIKLFIILDHPNGDIPNTMLHKALEHSFKSMLDAFQRRDVIVMQEIAGFVLDLAKTSKPFAAILQQKDVQREIGQLLSLIDPQDSMETDGAAEGSLSECIAPIFRFITIFVEFKKAPVVKSYRVLVELALKWMESIESIVLLRNIVQSQLETEVSGMIIEQLPFLVDALASPSPSVGEQRRKCAILQLLQVLTRTDQVRARILEVFHANQLEGMFGEVMQCDLIVNQHFGSIDEVNLYVFGVLLAKELSQHNATWLMFYQRLMRSKQIHLVLAQSLYESRQEVKSLVLQLVGSSLLLHDEIAKAMETVQPMGVKKCNGNGMSMRPMSTFSRRNCERIDEIIEKYQEIVGDNKMEDVLGSELVELYEYKLMATKHVEESLARANEKCSSLESQIAQLKAELNSSHQLLFRMQQSRENLVKNNRELNAEVKNVKSALETFTVKTECLKNDLSMKEAEMTEIKSRIKESDEKVASLKLIISQLENNGKSLEIKLSAKDETIKQARSKIEMLNSMVKEMESKTMDLEAKMVRLNDELNEKNKVIEVIKQVTMTR